MKKVVTKFAFIIILLFGFTLIADAKKFTVPADPAVTDYGTLLNNNQYYIDGTPSLCAYCLSPDKHHGSEYKGEAIDPSKNMYYLALFVAYSRLASTGYVSNSGQNGKVISATFRLIASYYSELDTAKGYVNSVVYSDTYKLKGTELVNKDIWNTAEANIAYETFIYTINTLNGATGKNAAEKYNALVANHTLVTEYNFSATVTASSTVASTGRTKVLFTITDANGNPVDSNSWTCAKEYCNKLTYSDGVYDARVNKGLTSFKIQYNTPLTNVKRIYIVKDEAHPSEYQVMAVVDSSNSTYELELPVTPSETPSTPTPPPPPPPPQCTFVDTPTGRVYYGFNQPGVQVPEYQYKSECKVFNCDYDSSNAQYYCYNPDPDLSGRPCNYEDYIKECTPCGQKLDLCSANPNDPNCVTYWEECPNCNPSVSMPSTCNDFNEESTIKGTISDINKTKTSCNYSEMPIKGCVIGGSDLAGNKYKLDVPELKDNKYCRIYCYEEYTFNVPTAKHTTSGGYFNLAMSVSGTRNCYLGSVNRDGYDYNGVPKTETFTVDRFLKEVEQLKTELLTVEDKIRQKKSEYASTFETDYNNKVPRPGVTNDKVEGSKKQFRQEIVSLANEFINKYDNLLKTINDYQKCASIANIWTNDLNFNPSISYEYKDYSGSNYNKGNLKKVSETTTAKNTYCYGKTDTHYNCLPLDGEFQYKMANLHYGGAYQPFINTGNYQADIDEPVTNGKVSDNVPSDDKYYIPYKIPDCSFTKIRDESNIYNDYYREILPDKNRVPAENPYPETDYRHKRFEEGFPVMDIAISCNWEDKVAKLSLANGVKKSVTKTATYVPDRSFYTYHQYGTITSGDPCNGTGYNNCLWTRLPETALPVELKTGKGAFPFKIYVNNIGQYSNGTLGRLVGNSESVLNKYNSLPAEKKCTYNENTNGPGSFQTLVQDVGYVCAYVNNCDTCSPSCVGDDCHNKDDDDCTGTNCPVKCRTCIFDGTNTRYKYRTISLNNVFPNSCSKTNSNCRSEGYNWYYKSSSSGTSSSTRPVNNKATVTVKEIEDKGESIYNDGLEYSYTVTAANMIEMQKYDRAVKSYANTTTNTGANALSCDQVNYNGISYSVRCKSTFLRDSKNEGVYFKTNKINNTFKLWTESGYCPNGNCLSIQNGIGPSWK